jgi:hypothetical protein
VLWNTQYIDDAIGDLRRSGRESSDEHLARLSPLQNEHILTLGTSPSHCLTSSPTASGDGYASDGSA